MHRTFIIPALLVCVGFFGCRDHIVDSRAISDHFTNETPVVKLQSYLSPDQRFRASVYFKYDNPRFDDSFWTFLVVTKATEKDDPRDSGKQIVRLYGSSAIWCSWKATDQLKISYAGTAGDKVAEWNGIQMLYEELKGRSSHPQSNTLDLL